METETDLMILEVPVLDDETVDALQTFLWDLLRQFENHYFHQLRRYHRKLDAETRDPLEPWKRLTPSPPDPDPEDALDDELNDDITF